MYLANTMNIVQALDAATGELIWEHHVGPSTLIGFGSMRNMAIYGDKVFFATTDARLVALDARTGKLVWDTVIADRAKGFSNTSGPIVIRGKVVQGLQGCDRYREERCFISAYDADTGKLAVEVPHRGAHGRAGRRHLGQAARHDARRRRDLDRRQLRSGSRPHLLGHRAGQAVDAGQPRHQRPRRGALHRFDRRAAARRRVAGVALPAHAGRVARPRRSVRARARRHRRREGAVHHRQGGHPVEARSAHRRSFSATRKRSSRTSSTRIDPKTGVPTYRADILEQKIGQWIQACPSTEGGHNWQAMSYHPGTRRC